MSLQSLAKMPKHTPLVPGARSRFVTFIMGVLGLLDLDNTFGIDRGDGSVEYASRGRPGSVYMTRDGNTYMRTRNGTRRIVDIIGRAIIETRRKRRIRTAALRSATAPVVAALILILAQCA